MLPSEGGTYAFLFALGDAVTVRVGRLGVCVFAAGCYVYVGSALGGGGLRARLCRHLKLKQSAKSHWHIDVLRPYYCPLGGYYAVSRERLECLWVRRLLALQGVSVPLRGFGASDCRTGCPAHLLLLNPAKDVWDIHEALECQAKLIRFEAHWAENGLNLG
ncbi:MAG: GIY-YIG nuclease family protein [Anaerolineae bacterium]|nr:GIY-YIG nuclease family protein [Anaerolineae bacterium]